MTTKTRIPCFRSACPHSEKLPRFGCLKHLLWRLTAAQRADSPWGEITQIGTLQVVQEIVQLISDHQRSRNAERQCQSGFAAQLRFRNIALGSVRFC